MRAQESMRMGDRKQSIYLEWPYSSILTFFQFEWLPNQFLSPGEAKQCLVDFVTQAHTALEELQKLGYAHADVSLQSNRFILTPRFFQLIILP